MAQEQVAEIDQDVDRLVVVSDLHGVRESLEALDRKIDALGDGVQVLCCGDVVAGGIDPVEYYKKLLWRTQVKQLAGYLTDLVRPISSREICSSISIPGAVLVGSEIRSVLYILVIAAVDKTDHAAVALVLGPASGKAFFTRRQTGEILVWIENGYNVES